MSDLLLNTSDTFTLAGMTRKPLRPDVEQAAEMELARKRAGVFAAARARGAANWNLGRKLVEDARRRKTAAAVPKAKEPAKKPKPPVTGKEATRAFIGWITEARKAVGRIGPNTMQQRRRAAIDAGADANVVNKLGLIAPVSKLARAAENRLIEAVLR